METKAWVILARPWSFLNMRSERPTKHKGYCFTINNPGAFDAIDLEQLRNHCSLEYLVYGKEVGELGTPHIQGFVRFKSQVHFTAIKRILSRAHIEIQKGTSVQAAEYCKKDGDFVEYGSLVVKKTAKEKWRDIVQWSETGEVEKIRDEYPDVYFLHRPKILSLRSAAPSILDELSNEWWVGKTGTGKSSKLWRDYPDHYSKQLNKWWDGYNGEHTVAIEEFNPESGKYLAHFVKVWADRYPFPAEIKGSCLKRIRPLRVIILSNYTPEECFSNENDLGPILRRFKVVHFRSLTNNE